MGAKFRQPPFSVAEANIISKSITVNGTYNASSDNADGYNPVTVSVPASALLSGTTDPLNSQGNNGDTYIKYTFDMNIVLATSIVGGYNGGAPLRCYVNDTLILSATGTSPYNLDYDVKHVTYEIGGHIVSVTVTPPTINTAPLMLVWLIDNTPVWNEDIMPVGTNTSYGYNTEETHTETIAGSTKTITGIYYKQSGVWLSIGDVIVI